MPAGRHGELLAVADLRELKELCERTLPQEAAWVILSSSLEVAETQVERKIRKGNDDDFKVGDGKNHSWGRLGNNGQKMAKNCPLFAIAGPT